MRGEFPRELFARQGIKYELAPDPKSTIYVNFLPLINRGKVRLLGNKRLVTQLIGLERRTSRAGRDLHRPRPWRSRRHSERRSRCLALGDGEAAEDAMRAPSTCQMASCHWRDEEPRNAFSHSLDHVDKDGNEVLR